MKLCHTWEESQLSLHANKGNCIVGHSSISDKPLNYQNCASEYQRNLWNVKRWAWGHISLQLQMERTLIQIKRAGVVLFQDEAVWLTNLGTEASGISEATQAKRRVIVSLVNSVNEWKNTTLLFTFFTSCWMWLADCTKDEPMPFDSCLFKKNNFSTVWDVYGIIVTVLVLLFYVCVLSI